MEDTAVRCKACFCEIIGLEKVEMNAQSLCYSCQASRTGRKCGNCDTKKLANEFIHKNSIICRICYNGKVLNINQDKNLIQTFLTNLVFQDELSQIQKKYNQSIENVQDQLNKAKERIAEEFYMDPYDVSKEVTNLEMVIESESLKESPDLALIQKCEKRIEKLEDTKTRPARIEARIEQLEAEIVRAMSKGYCTKQIFKLLDRLRDEKHELGKKLRSKELPTTQPLKEKLRNLLLSKERELQIYSISDETVAFFIDLFNEGKYNKLGLIDRLYVRLERSSDSSKVALLDSFIGDQICSHTLKQVESDIQEGKTPISICDIRPSEDPVYSFFKKYIVVCKLKDDTKEFVNLKKIVRTTKLFEVFSKKNKLSNKEFVLRLDKILLPQGILRVKSGGNMIYRGITICEDQDDEDDQPDQEPDDQPEEEFDE